MYCHNLNLKNKFSPCLEETNDSKIYLSKLKKECSEEYLNKRKKLILDNQEIYKLKDNDLDYVFFLFTVIYFFTLIIIYELKKPFKISSFLNEFGSLGIEFRDQIIDNIGLSEFRNRSKKNKSYLIKIFIISFLVWFSIKIYFYYYHSKSIKKYNKIFNKKCEKSIKINCCSKFYNLNEYEIQIKAKKKDELSIENIKLKNKIKKINENIKTENIKSTVNPKENNTQKPTYKPDILNSISKQPNTIEPIEQNIKSSLPLKLTEIPTYKPNSLNLKTKLPNTIEPLRQISGSLPPLNITQIPTFNPHSLNLKTKLPNTIEPIRQIRGSLPPINIQTNIPTRNP